MIAVIDYRAGNLTSVHLACTAIGAPAVVTGDAGVIAAAQRIIFPGVGSAGAALRNLEAAGLMAVLRNSIKQGKPFLGICLGAQVLFDFMEEDGGVTGLGLLPGRVRKFHPADRRDKVPHIGWNAVTWTSPHPLWEHVEQDSEFYFVHSYYMQPDRNAHVLGETGYAGIRFAAAVNAGNLAAVQFHPEKSGRIGLQLLRNFAAWNGRTAP